MLRCAALRCACCFDAQKNERTSLGSLLPPLLAGGAALPPRHHHRAPAACNQSIIKYPTFSPSFNQLQAGRPFHRATTSGPLPGPQGVPQPGVQSLPGAANNNGGGSMG